MNITRSEKAIVILLCTNAITGYYLSKSYQDQQVDEIAVLKKHELISNKYESDVYKKNLNDDLVEYMREDGSKAIALANGKYVFYGNDLSVDQVLWSDTGLVESINLFHSSDHATAHYNDFTQQVEILNFGSVSTDKSFSNANDVHRKQKYRESYKQGLETASTMSSKPSFPSKSLKSESLVTEPQLSPNEFGKELTEPNSFSPSKPVAAIPGSDCEFHYCKDGDLPAYPLPYKALKDMATLNAQGLLPEVLIGPKDTDYVDISVLWDVDCPRCKTFYKNTISPLIKEGKTVRLVLMTNERFDSVSQRKWDKITQLACDVDPMRVLQKHNSNLPYLPNSKDNCSVRSVKKQVKALKDKLEVYGLSGPTPISFTRKAMLYGAIFNLDDTKRYLINE